MGVALCYVLRAKIHATRAIWLRGFGQDTHWHGTIYLHEGRSNLNCEKSAFGFGFPCNHPCNRGHNTPTWCSPNHLQLECARTHARAETLAAQRQAYPSERADLSCLLRCSSATRCSAREPGATAAPSMRLGAAAPGNTSKFYN